MYATLQILWVAGFLSCVTIFSLPFLSGSCSLHLCHSDLHRQGWRNDSISDQSACSFRDLSIHGNILCPLWVVGGSLSPVTLFGYTRGQGRLCTAEITQLHPTSKLLTRLYGGACPFTEDPLSKTVILLCGPPPHHHHPPTPGWGSPVTWLVFLARTDST